MSRFTDRAPGVMKRLMADFGLDKESAAAILGNLYAESKLEAVQEGRPISGRGGFGWAQWTGPRRVNFEQYVARNNLDIKSDEANYKFLFTELKGPESRAISAVKSAVGLENKTIAFEKAFERAGVKNYSGRIQGAKIALQAYNAAGPSPVTQVVAAATAAASVPATAVVAHSSGFTVPQISVSAISVGLIVLAIVLVWRLWSRRKEPEMAEEVKTGEPERKPDSIIDEIRHMVDHKTEKTGIDLADLPQHLERILELIERAQTPLHNLRTLLWPDQEAQQAPAAELEGKKNPLTSTTILSGLAALVGGAAGVTHSAATGDAVNWPELVVSTISSLGGVGAIIGRFTATKKV